MSLRRAAPAPPQGSRLGHVLKVGRDDCAIKSTISIGIDLETRNGLGVFVMEMWALKWALETLRSGGYWKFPYTMTFAYKSNPDDKIATCTYERKVDERNHPDNGWTFVDLKDPNSEPVYIRGGVWNGGGTWMEEREALHQVDAAMEVARGILSKHGIGSDDVEMVMINTNVLVAAYDEALQSGKVPKPG